MVTNGVYAPLTCSKTLTIIDGGGAQCCATFSSTSTWMEGFTLRHGQGYNGGGVYSGTLVACVLTNNVAASIGGGAFGSVLSNCVVTGNAVLNSGQFTGGGGAAGGMLYNCIVWGNTGSPSPDFSNYGVTSASAGGQPPVSGTIDLDFCCTSPLPSPICGTNNIVCDPLFLDTSDFRLAWGSLCIDAGTNLTWRSIDKDFAGNPRLDNARIEIGAHEFAQGSLRLPEALDCTGRAWTTGGGARWLPQTVVSSDGADAAQGGAIGDASRTWLQTEVASSGTLAFQWCSSCEAVYDSLAFVVDGAPSPATGTQAFAHGAVVTASVTSPWVLPPGAEARACSGWTRTGILPASGTDTNTAFMMTTDATLTWLWRTQYWLDTTGLVWTTGGDASWTGQTAVAWDGIDAARSGAIGNLGLAWLSTHVTGPGTLAFRWRCDAEPQYDFAYFLTDGAVRSWLTGPDSGWQAFSVDLGAGGHDLRWEYWKDESVSVGADACWVDQVTWSGSLVHGFDVWTQAHGLVGTRAVLFAGDRDGDGVPNGLEYAFGTNWSPGLGILNILLVSGSPTVEVPSQQPNTIPFAAVGVAGCTNLPGGADGWTLFLLPAANTTGKPANRDWFVPAGAPCRAFFRVEADLIE